MLCKFMRDRIISNLYGSCTVHRRGIRASQEIPKSASNHRNHTTSAVVVVNAQSSASVLDRETTACFLDFHARGEEGWDTGESDVS
jgi:hypothetical protein